MDFVPVASLSSDSANYYLSDGCLMLLILFFQDNKDLYAEEAAAQRERERQRMLAIPGLIAPSELQDEMVDS